MDLLFRMLESLRDTAEKPDLVEVVLRCDNDDNVMIDFLRKMDLTFISGPRYAGYATLGIQVNEAARLSHADLVIVVNDDAVFRTNGWDDRLLQEASRYPDGIYDLGVNTVMNNENFVFPCTSRRVIDLIGIHDDRVVYNDIWLRDVMKEFGRTIRVDDVIIEHLWQGMSDDQRGALGVVQAEGYGDHYTRCVDEARAMIRGAMSTIEDTIYRGQAAQGF